MNPILVRLVRVLTRLYPDVASTTFFMAAAGINSGRILSEQAPLTRWFFIVSEAEKDGKIAPMLVVALADYANDEELIWISSELTPTIVEMPQYDLKRVVPPTPTGKEIDRILGGSLTTAFPDCAAVGNEKDGYFCSGTLVGPQTVLSAKHCAEVDNTLVYLGGYDVNDDKNAEIVRVVSRRLHPTEDVLILHLEKPAVTRPRRIATSAEIDSWLPMTCTLVGFGATSFDGRIGYGVKRRVEVPIATLLCGGPEDQKDWGCVSGTEMVAGHRGLNRDSCHGDSGGPLYVQGPSGDFFLLGVTSRGAYEEEGCGDGGIYVRADKLNDWIGENACEQEKI